ncbi:MAG: hypothetical protein V4498_09745 [candidate division FCPU426 bacterium]
MKWPFLLILIGSMLPTGCRDEKPVAASSGDVLAYLDLLTRISAPTLAESERFYGECGGEAELDFLLSKCKAMGWGEDTKRCIEFTRDGCKNATKVKSLALEWIRTKFGTVGKKTKVIQTSRGEKGFEYELVEVQVGKSRLVLFHNLATGIPTGILVDVSKVDGKAVEEYRKQ